MPPVQPPLPPPPPPVADELQGAPLPWPNPAWLAQPSPSPYQEPPAPPETTPESVRAPEVPAPPPAPPASTQAGGQALQALDQAHAQGDRTVGTEWGGKNAPEAPLPSTGNPTLDYFASSEHEHERALRAATRAQEERDAFVAAETAKAAREQADAQAKADAMRTKAFDDAKAKREQLDKEAQDLANTKIDPDRSWKARGSTANMMLGLMAGLVGSSNQGLRTGKNGILDFVNAEAERDIQAQEQDLQTRNVALTQRRGILADQVQDDQARLDFQYKSINAKYEQAKNMITAIAMKYDSRIMTAKAMDAIQTLKDEQFKLGTDYMQRTADNALKREEMRQKWAQIGLQRESLRQRAEAARQKAMAGPSVRDQVAAAREMRAQEEYLNKRMLPGVKSKAGKDVYVLDERDTPRLKEHMDKVTAMNQQFNELESIYAKHGWKPFKEWSFWDPEAQDDAKRARLIMGNILPEWSKANEQGVIRDKEYPMYFKMFGDPNGLLDPRANFREMRRMSVQGMNNELRQAVKHGDVAWWEPETVVQGNEQVGETDTDVLAERQRQKESATAAADRGAPREGWEVVGQSPDGTKNITASGLVIPAGRQIVSQKTETTKGGTVIDVYGLDDGTVYRVERGGSNESEPPTRVPQIVYNPGSGGDEMPMEEGE